MDKALRIKLPIMNFSLLSQLEGWTALGLQGLLGKKVNYSMV